MKQTNTWRCGKFSADSTDSSSSDDSEFPPEAPIQSAWYL